MSHISTIAYIASQHRRRVDSIIARRKLEKADAILNNRIIDDTQSIPLEILGLDFALSSCRVIAVFRGNMAATFDRLSD